MSESIRRLDNVLDSVEVGIKRQIRSVQKRIELGDEDADYLRAVARCLYGRLRALEAKRIKQVEANHILQN